MVIFFTNRIIDNSAYFGEEEFKHCVKVLRHKRGDTISFIDGNGGRYKGEISAIGSKEFSVVITGREIEQMLPYKLNMAVAPTKNNERYEWFIEKAVELGVDEITPVIGEFSERKVFKTERSKKVILSAAKQSLKSYLPQIRESLGVKEFIKSLKGSNSIKLIGYCEEGEKISLYGALDKMIPKLVDTNNKRPEIVILIGPEGDFSADEVKTALENGFRIIDLGTSRLRTETAAIASVAAVYMHFMNYLPNNK